MLGIMEKYLKYDRNQTLKMLNSDVKSYVEYIYIFFSFSHVILKTLDVYIRDQSSNPAGQMAATSPFFCNSDISSWLVLNCSPVLSLFSQFVAGDSGPDLEGSGPGLKTMSQRPRTDRPTLSRSPFFYNHIHRRAD